LARTTERDRSRARRCFSSPSTISHKWHRAPVPRCVFLPLETNLLPHPLGSIADEPLAPSPDRHIRRAPRFRTCPVETQASASRRASTATKKARMIALLIRSETRNRVAGCRMTDTNRGGGVAPAPQMEIQWRFVDEALGREPHQRSEKYCKGLLCVDSRAIGSE